MKINAAPLSNRNTIPVSAHKPQPVGPSFAERAVRVTGSFTSHGLHPTSHGSRVTNHVVSNRHTSRLEITEKPTKTRFLGLLIVIFCVGATHDSQASGHVRGGGLLGGLGLVSWTVRLRLAHSFSTYRLQGRDHVVRQRKKSRQTARANRPSNRACSAGDQSPSPTATRSPKFPRNHVSQGKVNVRLFCATTSAGSKSFIASIKSDFGLPALPFSDSGTPRTYSTNGASRNGTRTSSE